MYFKTNVNAFVITRRTIVHDMQSVFFHEILFHENIANNYCIRESQISLFCVFSLKTSLYLLIYFPILVLDRHKLMRFFC